MAAGGDIGSAQGAGRKQKMTSTQRKALLCLALSGAIFITWGSFIGATSHSGMGAFKAIFYGTRCLMQDSDPYNPPAFQRVYQSEGGSLPADPVQALLFRRAMLVCVNLPTSLFLVAPLALLPWRIASLLWIALNAAGLLLGALLVWMVAEVNALKPATSLICLLLCNAELVLALGNLAGITISLCIIAVWCFLEERLVRTGIVCLAVSMVLKPHDAGLIWLYFLLAGGLHRKRALQALVVAAALALPAILWVSHVSPRWFPELHANLAALSAHGSVNDPGPDSLSFHSADHVISLQAPFSLVRDDPRFYNPASYVTCGLLFLAFTIRVLKSRFTQQNAWFALAAISALSMLPVYHRAYDAKLLLLTVPACALLWDEGGRLKWIAGLMTTLAILATADVPAAMLLNVMNSFKGGMGSVWGRLLTAFVFHPAPVILLATGIFYLWAYYRRTAREKQEFANADTLLGLALASEP
jgi:hypothetical protein